MIPVHRRQRYKFSQVLAASWFIGNINCHVIEDGNIYIFKTGRKCVKCAIIICIYFTVSFAVVNSTSQYIMLLPQWLIGEQFHVTGTSGTELSTITTNTGYSKCIIIYHSFYTCHISYISVSFTQLSWAWHVRPVSKYYSVTTCFSP
jgi:hypothetical protein